MKTNNMEPIDFIVINKESYSWNQNGKVKFHEIDYSLSIGKENFPFTINRNLIIYVRDRGIKTYGKTPVREIFISLVDGELILWNNCAKSFLHQYNNGEILTLKTRSVTLYQPKGE